MKDKRKSGFTLVEAVLCVAIIGVIALGYMYLTSGSANIFKAGTNYDQMTSELITAAQNGTLSEGMTESAGTEITRIYLSGDSGMPIEVNRITLSGAQNEGTVYYYAFYEGNAGS